MPNIDFFLTSLVVVLIPGTGVIYTVSAGLFASKRAAMAAAFGCTLGIVPHLLASISGLSLLLHTSAVAFQTVKIAGACYLLYLAWCMWRETGAIQFDDSKHPQEMWQIALRAILINILNPKLSIFFLSFLPLFVSPEAPSPHKQMLILSAIFMGLTFIVFIFYGIFAHSVRNYVLNSPKILWRLQRSFALIFAALGIRLGLSDQY